MRSRWVRTEAEAVAGPAIFAEWLAARQWRPVGVAETLEAVAAFAVLDRWLGWAGNLRRHRSERPAIRRGERSWSFGQLAASDAAWQAAAGERADGCYDELVRMVADHLLCADTRPDDILVWGGDLADPWPFAALAIGASLVLTPPPPVRDGR